MASHFHPRRFAFEPPPASEGTSCTLVPPRHYPNSILSARPAKGRLPARRVPAASDSDDSAVDEDTPHLSWQIVMLAFVGVLVALSYGYVFKLSRTSAEEHAQALSSIKAYVDEVVRFRVADEVL